MGKLLVKDKEVVVPGEILADGMDYLPGMGTYRDGDKILSSRLGLTSVEGRAVKLIPLTGRYNPKRGDTVIGKVTEIFPAGWRADINCAYPAMVPLKDASSDYIARGADLTKYYTFGDYIVAKITNVTSQKLIDLSMRGPGLRKLSGGRIIKITSTKVPRIIGKKGSMVSMIKLATGCRIVVGQNGVVWVSGEEPDKELLAVETIKKIEKEAHIAGLTDRIKEFLEKKTGTKIEMRSD